MRGEVIDGAERMQIYGITSHPLKGADVLVLSVGGVRQHPVVLIDDRRHRVRGLAEGEVCIYTDEDESGNMHRILLKRGREIEMRSGDASVTIAGNRAVSTECVVMRQCWWGRRGQLRRGGHH